MDLSARGVLVTGAGSGIGRACAHAVAGRGAAVWLVDVDDAGMAATLADLPGDEHLVATVDVSDVDAVGELFARLAGQGRDLAGVVNAAGILTGGEPWPASDLHRMRTVLAVNIGGALTTTTLAARYPVAGQRAVVNISSVTALRPHPPDPAYSASKSALLALTRSAAASSVGVRVNAVLPGAVRTPMLTKTGPDGVADWLTARMDRPMLTPEQVAEVVLTLLTGEHNGQAWTIEADKSDPTRVRTEAL